MDDCGLGWSCRQQRHARRCSTLYYDNVNFPGDTSPSGLLEAGGSGGGVYNSQGQLVGLLDYFYGGTQPQGAQEFLDFAKSGVESWIATNLTPYLVYNTAGTNLVLQWDARSCCNHLPMPVARSRTLPTLSVLTPTPLPRRRCFSGCARTIDEGKAPNIFKPQGCRCFCVCPAALRRPRTTGAGRWPTIRITLPLGACMREARLALNPLTRVKII